MEVKTLEITDNTELFAENGQVPIDSWSRSPFFTYSRASVQAPLRRVKEWDRYFILSEQVCLSFALADYGLRGCLQVSLVDLANNKSLRFRQGLALPFGSLSLPESSSSGTAKIMNRLSNVDFSAIENGGKIIKVDIPSFDANKGLRGALILSSPPEAEIMASIGANHKNTAEFFYSQRQPSLIVEGVMRYGDRDIVFMKDEAFGVFSWGRGLRPRKDSWTWLAASGLWQDKERKNKKRLLGLNLASAKGNWAQASENALFIDGKIHKLEGVHFERDSQNELSPWNIRDKSGKIEVHFEPSLYQFGRTGHVFMSKEETHIYGEFRGNITIDEGRDIEFINVMGFIECAKNKW